jgi:hypothetical protein
MVNLLTYLCVYNDVPSVVAYTEIKRREASQQKALPVVISAPLKSGDAMGTSNSHSLHASAVSSGDVTARVVHR